jgi:hypothetical protein
MKKSNEILINQTMSKDNNLPKCESFGNYMKRVIGSELNVVEHDNGINIEPSETVESLKAQKAKLIEALMWISVEEKLPNPLQTVWITNGKGWTSLGCLVEDAEGWHWAESNGIIYQEGNDIVSECESDDLDVNYWMALPKVIITESIETTHKTPTNEQR